MQDRVSLYPGRVKLTPVAGQANTYDLTRADQPTQEGTPLNKASLLKDTTAALFGLTTDAVPDDVLASIKTLIDSANANADTKAKFATGYYTGTGVSGKYNPNDSLTLPFTPKVLLIFPSQDDSSYNYIDPPAIFNIDAAQYYKDQTNNTLVFKQRDRDGNTGLYYIRATFSDDYKTMFWWSDDAKKQLNTSKWLYFYIAIG